MPRKSALLMIQEIKQPSTAKTPICLWTYIIQTVIQGLYFFFFPPSCFNVSFHIPFEVQTGWDFSFLILPCPVPVQVRGDRQLVRRIRQTQGITTPPSPHAGVLRSVLPAHEQPREDLTAELRPSAAGSLCYSLHTFK